ncbi:10402_t:CDS:2, partial [Paraglomus brasilianum]
KFAHTNTPLPQPQTADSMNNIYFFLVLLIASTFLMTTTVTAVPALVKRDCSSFTISYPAGGETLKYGSNQNVTVQIGSSGVYVITTVSIYDSDYNFASSLFGDEAPVGGKSEVTVSFDLNGNFSPGEYHYKVEGYYTPTSACYTFTIGTIASKPNITETTVSFDVSLSQYVKTNTESPCQPFTVTAFHSTKIKHLLNRTKVHNVGSRVKIEDAVELHNNIICELQHATFVIPKNTTSNDTNTAVSPPSSRRATIVRSIAEQSPPPKKQNSSILPPPSQVAPRRKLSQAAPCKLRTSIQMKT